MVPPFSILDRASVIIEMYLFTSFAVFTSDGHNSVANLSLSDRVENLGLNEDITQPILNWSYRLCVSATLNVKIVC